MAGHRAELWHTIYAPHTNAVGQLVSGPGDILLLRHNATLPQQPGRPSSRRQADCRNRHWTDRWHRPLIRSRSGWRSAHWRANPLIGRTRRFPARQAAHEEFAPGAPLPLLWIGTAGGGQARAVGLPPPRHHEREGLRAVGELREPGTECRVRTFFYAKTALA